MEKVLGIFNNYIHFIYNNNRHQDHLAYFLKYAALIFLLIYYKLDNILLINSNSKLLNRFNKNDFHSFHSTLDQNEYF